MVRDCSFGIVAVLVVVCGCQRSNPPAVVAPAAPATTISVIKPEKKRVERTIEQPGTVQPFEETWLSPKVPGYVSMISTDPNKVNQPEHDRQIDIGSRVRKDQVLVELSVPELDEEFKQKEALVRQADAEVVQAKKAQAAAVASVNAARAQVAEAQAGLSRAQALYERWQSEVSRIERLVSGGVIDSQTRDETQNQFKSAEASRNEATARVNSAQAAVLKFEADQEKSQADILAAEARLDVAKVETRRVDALRSYLRIKAPFDGIITRRHVNSGEYVTSDAKPGLLAVARIDPVRVVVSIPETDAGLINSGQDIQLQLLALKSGPLTGKVSRTSWSLEPGSRTLRVELDVPNPEALIRPGMYAYARITLNLPEGWSVPAAALAKLGDVYSVYLVEGGKAVRVPVQPGRGDSRVTQILRYKRPGANDWTEFTGEEAIATPAAQLSDGMTLPTAN